MKPIVPGSKHLWKELGIPEEDQLKFTPAHEDVFTEEALEVAG